VAEATSPPVSDSTELSPGSDPPRILVVAPQPFFQERGTPIALRWVVESLSELGFGVDVLTFPIGESERCGWTL
jgi:hypothetical protein